MRLVDFIFSDGFQFWSLMWHVFLTGMVIWFGYMLLKIHKNVKDLHP